jgi:hypothetical protein
MIMFTPWLRLTAVKNEIAEANAVGYEALTQQNWSQIKPVATSMH